MIIGVERIQGYNGTGRRVPLQDIIAQHRERYVLKARIGDIVLKRLTYLDLEAVSIHLMQSVDGYMGAITDAAEFSEKLKYGSLSPPDEERYHALAAFLQPHLRAYFLRCFVEPILTTAEDFDAILGALTPSESAILLNALSVLTSAEPGEVDVNGLLLAAESNIPVSRDMTLETITAQQATVLNRKSTIQNENIQGLLK